MTKKNDLFMALGNPKRPLTDFDFANNDAWADSKHIQATMREIYNGGIYTPDLPVLYEKKHHYVFVYGTLKKNFRNHKWLDNAELVGCGFTSVDRFFMANNTRYGYPVVFFTNDQEIRGRVYGEVYKVAPHVIKDLDYLESNGMSFKRHHLTFHVANSKETNLIVQAWIYVGVKTFWNDRAENLEIVKRCFPRNGELPYFIYTKAEE